MDDRALAPALYLVPTPIGNLEDITLRALRVLRLCDIIACEDTRTTYKLLKLLGISPKLLVSYFEHNERIKAASLIDEVISGKSVAVVSEAGTPVVSDPGWAIVQEAINRNITVVPLPGATAFVSAAIASGLPMDKFSFMGFPPHKKSRQSFLKKVEGSDITVILYESPHRIVKLVDELSEICNSDRRICIARELTKIHEEFIRGTILEVKEIIKARSNLKGEFVVILEGKK